MPMPGISCMGAGGASLIRPDFAYREYRTTGLNQTTYTFLNCNIGTAHYKRLVVVGVFTRTTGQSSVTIGGVSATRNIYTTGSNCICGIYSALVPSLSTATVLVNTSGTADGCDIAVWSGYPDSATPVDTGSGTSSGGNITLSNISKTDSKHGFVVAYYNSNSTGSAMSASQTGAETLTEDFEYNGFSGSVNRLAGYSHIVTASTTTDDYTFVATGSNNEAVVIASFA